MFTGFSDATIDFLWELRFHNERPWFLEHKQVFLDTLDRPMKALAADVTAALEQAYPDRKWYLHVARIYRDARRLHGNGPYKENLWFTLRCDSSRGPEIPAFYFEITPHNYSYGMGFYWAKANTMACFRRAIDADPLPLTALAEQLNAQDTFVLTGQDYARAKGDLDGCDTLGGGITGVQDYPTLYAALAARGYDAALLQALFSDNWLRVLPK